MSLQQRLVNYLIKYRSNINISDLYKLTPMELIKVYNIDLDNID
jgi:hypothetical protein